MPEDVRFGGGGCRDVACPVEEKVKKCGFTNVTQTLVNMKISKGLNLAPPREKMLNTLTTRTTIICFKYYVFSFHIQIVEETTIENRVHETMVPSPWFVHVTRKTMCTKTMVPNPWFCA